jgi:hypothetical protein
LIGMDDHAKSGAGKGMPPSSRGTTSEEQVHDSRLIPGGSFQNANTPIGMNAVDREDLPSYAEAGRADTAEATAERQGHPGEPGIPASAANAPGTPRP